MPINIQSRGYYRQDLPANKINALIGNVGDDFRLEIGFDWNFNVQSNQTNLIQLYAQVLGSTQIELLNGNFINEGYYVGQSISVDVSRVVAGTPSTVTTPTVITAVTPNSIQVPAVLTTSDELYPSISGGIPANEENVSVVITNTSVPEGFDIQYNLPSNSNINTPNSVIDGEQTRLSYSGIDTIPLNTLFDLIQLGNKSGMSIYGATGQKVSVNKVVVDIRFKVTGHIDQTLFAAANCLGDFFNVKLYPQYNNPNVFISSEPANLLGNTGRFGENLNGGSTIYSLSSLSLSVGSSIVSTVDQGQTTSFNIKLSQGGATFTNSTTCRFEAFYYPLDIADYKNNSLSNAQNLMCTPFEYGQIIETTDAPTGTILGAENLDGARIDVNLLDTSINAAEMIVTGDLIPNAAFTSFINGKIVGNRRIVIYVSIGNSTLAANLSDRTNILVFDGQMEVAPIEGIKIPSVNQSLLDHNDNVITNSEDPNTTTGDDLLYNATFLATKDTVYEGVRTRVFAKKFPSGQEFDLEDHFFSFQNVPYVNGVHEPNLSVNRQFLLPSTFNRNKNALTRNSSLDTLTEYGLEINYGFLNDWRYWLAQPGISSDFFNALQANNGLNKDWQHYDSNASWYIYIGLYLRKNGVDDFNLLRFKIRPYDDDPTVSRSTVYQTANGTVTTSLISGGIMTVTDTLSWNQPFSSEWFEVNISQEENQRIGYLSSVLNADTISQGILQPITGTSKIDVTLAGNTAILKYNVNLLSLNANNLVLEVRAFSRENDDAIFGNDDKIEFGNGDTLIW